MDFIVPKRVSWSGLDNIYDIMTDIRDFCVDECGWILHDDHTSETDKYFVLKSHPDATTETEHPCYLGFKVFESQKYWMRFFMFLGFDNSTQDYTGIRVSKDEDNQKYWDTDNTQSYDNFFRRHILWFNDTGSNDLEIYGNIYFINMMNYRQDDDKNYGIKVLKLEDDKYDYNFKINNDVETGSNKQLQLDSGQASKILQGDQTWLLCKENHTFSKVEVTSVDEVNDRITAKFIFWPTVSGSYLGPTVRCYPWATKAIHDNDEDANARFENTFIYYDDSEVNNHYKDNDHNSNDWYEGEPDANWFPRLSPDEFILASVGRRTYIEDIIYYNDDNAEHVGSNDYFKIGSGEHKDTVGYNKLYVGTATNGTSDTLSDSSKSWEPDALIGKCIILTDGSGAGDVKHIIDNDEDTVTISGSFSAGIEETTEYGIFDQGYIKCKQNVTNDYHYLMRVA